jgi:hypothetical protein
MLNYVRYRCSLIRAYCQFLLDNGKDRVAAQELRRALITLVYYDGILKGQDESTRTRLSKLIR